MPILDVAAQNRSLDNDYGTTHGSHSPTAGHELALFDGDPSLAGVELDATDCPGYVRVPVAPTDWSAAAGGAKSSALMQFPDATDAWSTQPRYWALVDGDDHTTVWDYAGLTSALIVTGAGPGPGFRVTVFYANLLDD